MITGLRRHVAGQTVDLHGAGLGSDVGRHRLRHPDRVSDLAARVVVSAAGLGQVQPLALHLMRGSRLAFRIAVLFGDSYRAVGGFDSHAGGADIDDQGGDALIDLVTHFPGGGRAAETPGEGKESDRCQGGRGT